jgi:MFS family permease
MLKDVLMFGSFASAAYAWLCAIVAPLATALRSWVRDRRRGAMLAVGLACAGALLWTLVPMALTLLGMMLEPRAGIALLRTRTLGPGLAAGIGAWLLHLAVDRRVPRLGDTFEAATAIAIVAAVDDDERTLGKVESLYRALAIDGSRNVNTAPSGPLETLTSPPWRTTMARTIERPRPLPEGTRVPARDASAL